MDGGELQVERASGKTKQQLDRVWVAPSDSPRARSRAKSRSRAEQDVARAPSAAATAERTRVFLGCSSSSLISIYAWANVGRPSSLRPLALRARDGRWRCGRGSRQPMRLSKRVPTQHTDRHGPGKRRGRALTHRPRRTVV